MKTIYLGYHYNSVDGQHQNRILKSVEEVNSFLNARASEEYSSDVDNLVASIALMKAGQCKYIDIDHGDWITITQVDVEDAGITDREAIAVINALRVYQAEDDREDIIDDFGLDQDNMTDDEIENLIQRINLGEVEVEYAKPVAINKSLAERIREMAEGMAVSSYTSQDNTVSYERFMASKNVHRITSIWEPFETDTTENIQNNVENDARNLVGFAEAIIATVTTNDMLDIIGQRAYDAGVVNSRGNICLTSIHSITASQRDAAERCNGASPVNDGEVFINTEEYDGDDEIVKSAAKFGVSYVLAV